MQLGDPRGTKGGDIMGEHEGQGHSWTRRGPVFQRMALSPPTTGPCSTGMRKWLVRKGEGCWGPGAPGSVWTCLPSTPAGLGCRKPEPHLLTEGFLVLWEAEFGAICPSRRREKASGILSRPLTVSSWGHFLSRQLFCIVDIYITMYGFSLRLDTPKEEPLNLAGHGNAHLQLSGSGG